jgi:hypothetical protein
MNDSSLWLLVGYALGIILGWIVWSPDTRFKYRSEFCCKKTTQNSG